MQLSLSYGLGKTQFAGGVSYSAEAIALFARMNVEPDATRKGLINTLILALKTGAISASDIWAKLDALYVIAAHDEQAGQLNWKSSSYTLSAAGGMGSSDFTVDRGYLGDGVAKYLDTGFADNTAAVNWSQDSMSFGGWVNQDNGATSISIGMVGSSNVRTIPNTGASTASGRAHTSTSVSGASVNNRLGLTLINRSGASAQEIYRNTTQVATAATASSAVGSGNLALLRSNTAYANDRIAAASIGGSLSADEVIDLYNALNTFLTAIGGA